MDNATMGLMDRDYMHGRRSRRTRYRVDWSARGMLRAAAAGGLIGAVAGILMTLISRLSG